MVKVNAMRYRAGVTPAETQRLFTAHGIGDLRDTALGVVIRFWAGCGGASEEG
jgi:hypothetical protein